MTNAQDNHYTIEVKSLVDTARAPNFDVVAAIPNGRIVISDTQRSKAEELVNAGYVFEFDLDYEEHAGKAAIRDPITDTIVSGCSMSPSDNLTIYAQMRLDGIDDVRSPMGVLFYTLIEASYDQWIALAKPVAGDKSCNTEEGVRNTTPQEVQDALNRIEGGPTH